MISDFCLFSNYWTKMGLSCSPMCQKESCQSFLMRILFSLLSWLLSGEWLCSVPRKEPPRVPCGRVVRCTFTGTQSHSGTGLNWSMVCTLCMTPISHLYDLIVVIPMIFTDVDLDHLFFLEESCPYPTNHSLLSRAAKWKLKRCKGLLGAVPMGEFHAVWMWSCQKACISSRGDCDCPIRSVCVVYFKTSFAN